MTTKEPPYQPVSCALHSEYELAIMRRTPIDLRWVDQHNQHQNQRLLPIDLTTRQGEEFLIVRTQSGQEITIRLDKILQ